MTQFNSLSSINANPALTPTNTISNTAGKAFENAVIRTASGFSGAVLGVAAVATMTKAGATVGAAGGTIVPGAGNVTGALVGGLVGLGAGIWYTSLGGNETDIGQYMHEQSDQFLGGFGGSANEFETGLGDVDQHILRAGADDIFGGGNSNNNDDLSGEFGESLSKEFQQVRDIDDANDYLDGDGYVEDYLDDLGGDDDDSQGGGFFDALGGFFGF